MCIRDRPYAFASEADASVRAAMWLAWAVHPVTERGVAERGVAERGAMARAGDHDAEGLLGWAATFAKVRASGTLEPDEAERLLPRRKAPRLPEPWAFATDDGPASVLDLAHALTRELTIAPSLISALAATARGPGAARHLAALVFGPFVARPGTADIVFTALPRAGLCAGQLTPLEREALAAFERLRAREPDPHLGWALGVGVRDTGPMLAGAAPFFVPLEPPMPGHAGATFWHLWRRVVLGDGPSVAAFADHLRHLPAEPLVTLALSQMQRALLDAQVGAHGAGAACRSRDAAILDALGRDPRLHEALLAHLAGYVVLGADHSAALGRMLLAAGCTSAEATGRIADAQRVYADVL